MTDTVLRYRFRAYPDAKQTRALSRTFGSCRVVANDAIAAREAARRAGQPYPKLGELSRTLITEAKRTPGRQWLSEVSSVALQQSLADADRAYRNFFTSLSGQRKGRRVGSPKFRSRHDNRQTARFTTNARFAITTDGDRRAMLTLPKIGAVAFVLSRPLPSKPTSVTVIREADGRTYVSFVVTVTNRVAPATGRVCGIDPGLSTFASIVSRTTNSTDTSTGGESVEVIDTPLFLRRKARALARSQRALARKQKGSANRAKAVRRVAVAHRKVRETRLDHAHQQAAAIVAAHDIIAIEDLSLSGMARTNLAASVHDQAIGQFLRLIIEKAERQGRTVVKVGRFYPSTQTCSACGAITGPKGRSQLHVRHWTCVDCGASHHRDVNAARNILTEGLRLLTAAESSGTEHTPVADGRSETLNACGDQVSPAAPSLALVYETGRTAGEVQPCPT